MGTAAKVWHRCRCAKTDGGTPMTQVDDLSRSLIAFEQNSTMVVVLEMSQSSWLAAGVVPGIERRPLKKLDMLVQEILSHIAPQFIMAARQARFDQPEGQLPDAV